MGRPYLDTIRTIDGEMDETLCPACGSVLYSDTLNRGAAMCCFCERLVPPVDTERTTFGYATLIWYPDVEMPIRAFGRIRAYYNRRNTPTVVFVALDGTIVKLPLLAVAWDQGARSLAYTVRGWDAETLPPRVRKYLSSHPTYGIPQVEEVRYLSYEEPAWPAYGMEEAARV